MDDALTTDKKPFRKHSKYIAIAALSCLIVGLMGFFMLWENGTIGTYRRGMAFLMEDSAYTIHYSDLNTVIETTLDLYDLESNAGKIIYDDNQCKIEVVLVRQETDGDYNVFFRSHGHYDRLGGTLVSATQQRMTAERLYTYDLRGKMQVVLGGTAYNSTNSATSSLIHKDGDEFGFHLFPLTCFENGKFLLADQLKQENGKVKIRLYHLQRMTWVRNG